MEESFESYFDHETLSLVSRFEKMIQEDQFCFFDVDEFEEIIEYYFFKNEQRKAQLTIRESLIQHPGAPSLLIKLAQYQINTKKDHEALKILKDVDFAASTDSDLLIAKGNLYSQLEKPDKAIEEYQKAIEGADYADEIYASIAYEYENLGRYDKAIENLLKAIDLNPENDAVIYEYAFCCEISQQTGQSISFLEKFLDTHPYSVSAWFNLGIAFGNAELFEKAIDAYDFVIAIDETFSSAYYNKANCFANIGHFEEAIETYFETFYYEDPEPVTHYYIAECYEKLKKFDKAAEYYQKAVALDPEFADAWLGIGISRDELGNPQAALPYIQKAIKLSPSIAEYYFILGDLQIKLSKIEDGIASYRKVIELGPEDPDIWLDLSVVYADQKDYQAALDVLSEGMNYHPAHVDFLYLKSWYLILLEKTREASGLFCQALSTEYEGCKRLLTTFPDASTHPVIIDLLQEFNDSHSEITATKKTDT